MTIKANRFSKNEEKKSNQIPDNQQVSLPPQINYIKFSTAEKIKDLSSKLDTCQQEIEKEKLNFKSVKKNKDKSAASKYRLKSLKKNKSEILQLLKPLKDQFKKL